MEEEKRSPLSWKLEGPLFSTLEELHEKLSELLGKFLYIFYS